VECVTEKIGRRWGSDRQKGGRVGGTIFKAGRGAGERQEESRGFEKERKPETEQKEGYDGRQAPLE